jgi:hypothetical protein
LGDCLLGLSELPLEQRRFGVRARLGSVAGRLGGDVGPLVFVRQEAGDACHVGGHEREPNGGERASQGARNATPLEHGETGQLAGLEQQTHRAECG